MRTLTLDNVLISEDQAIEINNRGLIGRKRQLDENGNWDFDENGNPYFEEEQVKLIHNSLIFTKNNWKGAETAIGKIAVGYNADGSVKYDYGFNGRVVIGELFLGNNLVLTGTGAGIKITDSNGNNAFYADDEGNLVLSGTIYAKSGQIGGWTLSNADTEKPVLLYKKYNSDTVSVGTGMACKDDDHSFAFYAGYTGSGEHPWNGAEDENPSDVTRFYVTNDGYIKASSGAIGSWQIAYNWIQSANIHGLPTSDEEMIKKNGIAFGFLEENHPVFLMRHFHKKADGSYGYTDPLYIDGKTGGISITGTINASSGKIGDWVIGSVNGTNASKGLYNSGDYGVGMFTNGVASHPAIWAGYTGGTSTPYTYPGDWTTCTNFFVTNGGYMKANDANITGTINATSGSFSNCTINKTCTIKKIEADEGYIGGWNILDGWIKGTDVGYSKTTLVTAQYVARYYTDGSGGGSVSWERIFSHIGIDTSDIRYKKNIEKMSDDYDVFFDLLNPVRYKYKDGNSGRYHTGFIAQEVVDSLEKSNLDTEQFAAVCLDKPANGDECWFLRRDEFVALNTWQIQKAKARITDLENTVAELKTQIQTLTAG